MEEIAYCVIILLNKSCNGQMYGQSNSQSSSGDAVHVFMSSFSETADAENTASVAHFSMCVCVCVCSKNRASVPFTYTGTCRKCRIHI